MGNKNAVNTNPKWENDLKIEIDNDIWHRIYKNCFFTIKDNYINWLQYKVINRILGTKQYQFKVGITTDQNCSLCNSNPETILHMFCQCPKTIELWRNVTSWIKNKLSLNINMINTTLNNETIILGYLVQGDDYTPFNTILLVSKSYIFWSFRHSKPLDIYILPAI